jgi:hypothetical protein
MRISKVAVVVGAALALAISGATTAAVMIAEDFGQQTERDLVDCSNQLFGVEKPIEASSTVDLTQAQALADPSALVTMAQGLKVSVVSAGRAAPTPTRWCSGRRRLRPT